MAKRRRIEAGVKAKVALAALRGDHTTNQLVSGFGDHTTQVGQKYEHLYRHDYATPRALAAGLSGYFLLYNEERIHFPGRGQGDSNPNGFMG
jgi:hypothetical protein